MTDNKKLARMTGVLYLLLALIGPFSIIYVPSRILVPGNGAETVSNIMANQTLFRLGMAGDTLVFLIEIVLVALLYRLLKSTDKNLSLAAALSRLAMTVIQAVNLFASLAILVLATKEVNMSGFTTEQINSMVLAVFKVHDYGVFIWGLFFGLHLILLGMVVYKASLFPKLLGILLLIGSVGYLMDSYRNILIPDNAVISTITSVFLALSVIGELGFTFYLLIKGVRE